MTDSLQLVNCRQCGGLSLPVLMQIGTGLFSVLCCTCGKQGITDSNLSDAG